MTGARFVQQSAFPEHRADCATGPLLLSFFAGAKNADLINAIAPLYLDGRRILDVTYGRGHWWKRYRPSDLTCHDLHTLDGVDFRNLPHAAGSFDTVCFDPPYVPHHSPDTSTARDFTDRFGLGERTAANPAELWELHTAGLNECARVTAPGGFVLVKCNDFTNARVLRLGHVEMINNAPSCLQVHDLIVHTSGTGPGVGSIREQIRTARAHSYLLVFRKRKIAKRGAE